MNNHHSPTPEDDFQPHTEGVSASLIKRFLIAEAIKSKYRRGCEVAEKFLEEELGKSVQLRQAINDLLIYIVSHRSDMDQAAANVVEKVPTAGEVVQTAVAAIEEAPASPPAGGDVGADQSAATKKMLADAEDLSESETVMDKTFKALQAEREAKAKLERLAYDPEADEEDSRASSFSKKSTDDEFVEEEEEEEDSDDDEAKNEELL